MNVTPFYRSNDTNPIRQLQQRYSQLLVIILVLSAIFNVLIRIVLQLELNVTFMLAIGAVIGAGLAALLLIQRNRIALGALLILVVLLAVLWISTQAGVILVVATIALISASALLPSWLFVLAYVIVLARMVLLTLVSWNSSDTAGLTFILGMTFTLVIIGFATRVFINTAQQTTEKSTRTADLLRATAEVGQITANLLKLEDLASRAVELIRDRFAFYHVQLFLVDEDRKYARLVASTGEIGQRLMQRGHRITVGSQSVIGRVTQIGEPVIARDTDKDPIHTANELLPNTRSELALPIVDGDRIIGALDVQSTRRDAFTPSDIQALQIMANQLATGLRNARLFEQQASNVQVNQRLLLETRTNLREIQRLNSQLSKKAWEDYLGEKDSHQGIILMPNAMESFAAWTPEMMQATTNQRPFTHQADGKQVTAVPIVLRGEVLGAIEIEAGDVTGSDLVEMMQAVAQNLAISLDSARLFEEAQETAAQEQRINTISEAYQSAASVDELLKITMEALSQTLGAETGAIRLGVLPTPHKAPDTPDPAPRLNGSQHQTERLNGGNADHVV
ncbi:MAG: GAF domain-containing protein [Armatimonadetes bacterium]|nr:GAF domain-containing protein [Anaerolineae bacterium]